MATDGLSEPHPGSKRHMPPHSEDPPHRTWGGIGGSEKASPYQQSHPNLLAYSPRSVSHSHSLSSQPLCPSGNPTSP